MKAIAIFLGYVPIINMSRNIFIGRTNTFTPNILRILGGVGRPQQQQQRQRQAGQAERGAETPEASPRSRHRGHSERPRSPGPRTGSGLGASARTSVRALASPAAPGRPLRASAPETVSGALGPRLRGAGPA